MEKEKDKKEEESALAKASAGEEKKESNIEELKKKLEECEKLKNEYLLGWQRERADLLNYKKEELERVGEILKYANVGLILQILSVLDNLDVVEKKLPENLKKDENVKGILQIKAQILDFLKSQGVEEIKTMGEKFDPNFMEIVETIEAKDKNSGIIVEEIQKGYSLHSKVLRPAKVKIRK